MSKKKRKLEENENNKKVTKTIIQICSKKIVDHIKLEINDNESNKTLATDFEATNNKDLEILESTIETLLTKIQPNAKKYSEEFDLFFKELEAQHEENQLNKINNNSLVAQANIYTTGINGESSAIEEDIETISSNNSHN